MLKSFLNEVFFFSEMSIETNFKNFQCTVHINALKYYSFLVIVSICKFSESDSVPYLNPKNLKITKMFGCFWE